MSEKVSGTTDKIEKIITIGGVEDKIRNLADALAADYQISAAPNVVDAAKRLTKESFSAIILDLAENGSDMVDILQALKKLSTNTPVIVIGNPSDTRVVVNAIKAGAFDFITRPYPPEKIKLSVHQALENKSLKNEIDYLRREQDVVYDYNRIIAVSPPMRKVVKAIKRLSQTDSTILVTCETGTGKSVLSGNIHFNSPRCSKAFIKVNCANIPETLLESELFGHEEGAFTGADKARRGRFEQAAGGTIFLDEFCELGLQTQAKLLRAIDEKKFERLGSNKTSHVDTRVIAATNRDIESLIREGKFREDLYYRINVLRIHLPPLREREDCIKPLAYFLLKKLGRSVKKKVEGFLPEVIEMFEHYHWPGNIRQLSNTIERALLLENDRFIRPQSVSLPEIGESVSPNTAIKNLRLSAVQEKQIIAAALEDNLWIQKDAARQLRITPRALNYRIKKLGITHPRWRKNK